MNYFILQSTIRVVKLENDSSENLEEQFLCHWTLLKNISWGKLVLTWLKKKLKIGRRGFTLLHIRFKFNLNYTRNIEI